MVAIIAIDHQNVAPVVRFFLKPNSFCPCEEQYTSYISDLEILSQSKGCNSNLDCSSVSYYVCDFTQMSQN